MLLSLLAKMAVVVMIVFGGNIPQNAPTPPLKPIQDDDRIVSVVIDPEMVELVKDQTFLFRAVAYNRTGNPVEFTPIWMATGGGITQTGLYTAAETGSYEVLASDAHTGIYAVAVVHIACHQAGEACLVIDPGRVELTKGEIIQFTASSYGESGGLAPIPVKWESGGGWIDENGVYTASEVGEFLVTATQVGSNNYGTAHISVRYVSILPPWMYLRSGKWWFSLIGILMGISIGMGVYAFRRDRTLTRKGLARE